MKKWVYISWHDHANVIFNTCSTFVYIYHACTSENIEIHFFKDIHLSNSLLVDNIFLCIHITSILQDFLTSLCNLC